MQRTLRKTSVSLTRLDLVHTVNSSFFTYVGQQIQVQEKLLKKEFQSQKPDTEFLKFLADVVATKWTSLAFFLSVSMEEEKMEGLSQEECAFQLLKLWSSREDATYGKLYQTLKTVSLFHSSTPSQRQ